MLFENEFSNLSIKQKVSNYSKFINYPDCLSKTFYSFRDIVILIKIAQYEAKSKILSATERLHEILKTDIIYVSGNSRFFMPSIFVSVVKIFGSLGNFQKALDISIEGIKYSKKIQDSRALPNLYHLSAISKYKLGLRDQFEDDIVNCISCALSSHDINVFMTYVKLINNAFGISNDSLINLINTKFQKEVKRTDED